MRLFQRWFGLLGMLAILSALIAMPLTATYAFAISSGATASADTTMSGQSDAMPCHKTGKSCPHCPQKFCPEMANCLVKCFQPLSAPISDAHFHRDVVSRGVAPAPTTVTAGSQIPPLLRPPSV
jgi:hypothetical protein